MDKKELALILKEGEGYFIEFKENLSGVEKEFVAFTNSSGGRVFLGVTDEGKVKGLKITNRLKSEIQNIARNCDPSIKIAIESLENILVVKIKEGEDKPYRCSSGFYKRIGSNSQKMTRSEILDFFKSEGKVRFDELINTKVNYPRDFSRKKLNEFLEFAGLSKSLSSEKVLSSLRVIESQVGKIYFNNAGILFFAKEPQKFIPWSVFTVALFKDKEGVDIIDRKEITGGLFEIVEQVMDFIRLYAKVAYRITGKPQRENIYEYPFEAIREAVINSVMHKDYFEHGHNNILKFFPDRIQIENIWLKPKKFILGETVFRRNQVVADLFSRIHFGEKMGSGMKRMRDVCKKEKAPYPKIKYTDTHFYIVFRQSREYLKMTKPEAEVTEKVTEKVTENQRKILEEISKDEYITVKRLSAIVGISERKIKENIKKLKQIGLIERIGPDKGGYWKAL
ncbi:MAG: ATP-dependent DNA helicase RecG [Candidatus Scalindua rubra]|uniref:ATP-dependent DNA helicase RecG n=1 Tax=Candidatus Scalindua rubra TaxID=1872076 RepID=A0A1E3X976_9BACT|nr:MAG: ATP-dependent DNA helicase RecG [Candidatus Scalindua rubra]